MSASAGGWAEGLAGQYSRQHFGWSTLLVRNRNCQYIGAGIWDVNLGSTWGKPRGRDVESRQYVLCPGGLWVVSRPADPADSAASGLSGRFAGNSARPPQAAPAGPADSADDLLESRPDRRPKQPQQAQRTQRTICWKVAAL